MKFRDNPERVIKLTEKFDLEHMRRLLLSDLIDAEGMFISDFCYFELLLSLLIVLALVALGVLRSSTSRKASSVKYRQLYSLSLLSADRSSYCSQKSSQSRPTGTGKANPASNFGHARFRSFFCSCLRIGLGK